MSHPLAVSGQLAQSNPDASHHLVLTGSDLIARILKNEKHKKSDLISNTAYLASTNAAPVSTVLNLPVLGTAELQLTKSADQDLVVAGGQIVYTMSYTNSGNATATGLLIEDGIPANTTYVSASNGGTQSDGIVIWNLADLAAGESASVQLTVEVDAGVTHNTLINNTATVSADITPPVSASVSVTAYNPLTVILVLRVELTPDQSEINRGGEIVYTVDYDNITPADALDLEIVALLPTNVVFVSATGGGIYASDGRAHSITWDKGTLAGLSTGQVMYRVRLLDTSIDDLGSQFAAGEEVVKGLVSVSASNTLPITNDFAASRVLVLRPDVAPVEFVPVPVLGGWGLGILVLLTGLSGAYWRRRRPNTMGSASI